MTQPISLKQIESGTTVIFGRNTAGAGRGEELTPATVAGMLPVFSTSAKGLVPATTTSNTTDFLRRDGTWATPPNSPNTLGPDGDKGDITVGGTGTTLTIDANAVTLAKMQQIATSTFLGRTSNGTGNVEALTSTQAAALIDLQLPTFNNVSRGYVPASGGGTTNFLRADGTFAAPPSSPNTLGPDGDKGDITVGGSGTTLTIDANAVTFAKHVAAPSAGFVGAAAAGNYSHFTPADTTALLPLATVTVKGLVPPPGSSSGRVLTDNMAWTTLSGGGGSIDPLNLATEYVNTKPAAPATGLTMFAIKRAGRSMPAWQDKTNRIQRVQQMFGSSNIYWDRAYWGVTTTNAIGVAWTGTLTAVAAPTTGFLGSCPRATMTIATAAGMIERRTNVNFLNRAAVGGGYHLTMRFGFVAMGTNAKVFYGVSGLAAGTAFSNQEPSTGAAFTQIFGIGKDSTDSALAIFSRGATGVTKTPLPNTGTLTGIANSMWQVDIHTVPGGTEMHLRVQRYDDATGNQTVDEVTVTATLPTADTYKGIRYWMGNTTAQTLTMAYIQTYVETE